MTKISKHPAASTTVDATIKTILDMIQRQNEQQESSLNKIKKTLAVSNEENKRRIKEIEAPGKTIAELQIGTQSIATNDFNSLITDDSVSTIQRPTKSQKKPVTPTNALLPDPFDEEMDYEEATPTETRPTLRANEAVHYIPTLNGDDDVGIEDFIEEVRCMRNMCTEKELLLKAIKVKKITGKAAQGIRNIPTKTYAELYDALRSNVATQITSDEYSEQLRELKQGKEETVQNFNISFRRILNKLMYAITNENPQPLTPRIMTEAATKEITRTYIKSLRRDLGRIILSSRPDTLIDAEKQATQLAIFQWPA